LRRAIALVQTCPDTGVAMLPLVLLGLFGLVLASALLWQAWRHGRRRRALVRLLDLADAVEALLDRSQRRMSALRDVVDRVPSDIGAVAQASLESTLPIREAKRDVLQHRLWIQKNGATATLSELADACAALERAKARLGSELDELDRAGADLAAATDAAAEAARREPPTLRRSPDD
jgi:hypothetical protein